MHAQAFKVRTGASTYVKPDGSVGTAGKGALVSDELAFTVSTVQDQSVATDWQPPRRLTPDECERLQGFPTGWTDVEHNGKPASDTARYRATGNSMAVPVMAWLGRRIEAFDVLHYDEVGLETPNDLDKRIV